MFERSNETSPCAALAVRILLCALSLWGALLARAADVKATDTKKPEIKKPAAPDPKSIAFINKTAQELVKEAAASMKEAGPNKLHDKSDLFGETPPPEATPDAILAALEKQQSSDPRVDAYVKWQLLSGVKAAFPDELAARAVNAYRRAPEPFAHPGLERGKLTSLLYKVGMMKKDRMDEVNKGFSDSVDKITADNLYILAYRKALYARLPLTGDSVMAGLDDVSLRVRRGLDANDHWETVAGSIQSWSLSSDARQRDAVAQSLNRLLATVKEDRSKPYTRVTWNEDPRNLGMHWEDRMGVADSKIQGLLESLKQAGSLMGDEKRKK